MSQSPKIIRKRDVFTCPWISLVESTVQMHPKNIEEAYYAIKQPDYVSIIAQLDDGKIPIVRQFRPAVDAFTLELPAGTLDEGESPEQTAVRELKEETGLIAIEVKSLGTYYADTGRLSNNQHVFFIRAKMSVDDFKGEPGVEVRFMTKNGLNEAIDNGLFRHQLHVGAFLLASKWLR